MGPGLLVVPRNFGAGAGAGRALRRGSSGQTTFELGDFEGAAVGQDFAQVELRVAFALDVVPDEALDLLLALGHGAGDQRVLCADRVEGHVHFFDQRSGFDLQLGHVLQFLVQQVGLQVGEALLHVFGELRHDHRKAFFALDVIVGRVQQPLHQQLQHRAHQRVAQRRRVSPRKQRGQHHGQELHVVVHEVLIVPGEPLRHCAWVALHAGGLGLGVDDHVFQHGPLKALSLLFEQLLEAETGGRAGLFGDGRRRSGLRNFAVAALVRRRLLQFFGPARLFGLRNFLLGLWVRGLRRSDRLAQGFLLGASALLLFLLQQQGPLLCKAVPCFGALFGSLPAALNFAASRVPAALSGASLQRRGGLAFPCVPGFISPDFLFQKTKDQLNQFFFVLELYIFVHQPVAIFGAQNLSSPARALGAVPAFAVGDGLHRFPGHRPLFSRLGLRLLLRVGGGVSLRVPVSVFLEQIRKAILGLPLCAALGARPGRLGASAKPARVRGVDVDAFGLHLLAPVVDQHLAPRKPL